MENKKPKVSVIVTTYNREKYLKETIQSILNQTFTDFELIVVDNFSNYNFFEVIGSFNDLRIKAFQNQNNGIIAVNRNFGLKFAIGEYVAFCDDDDLWSCSKLEYQLRLIMETDSDLCYSNAIFFETDTDNKVYETKCQISNLSDLLWNNQLILSSVVVKNTPDIYFNETQSIITAEDYYLWLELLCKGYKFIHSSEYLLNYRVSKNSQLRKNYNTAYLRCIIIIITLYIYYGKINFFSIFFRVNSLMAKYLIKSILKKNE